MYIHIQQDEWVVCRVFQKSGGPKKYPSNHTRGVNPYTLEIGPTINVAPPLMHHVADPNSTHFLYGRNYMSNAELAEIARVFRAGSNGGGSTASLNLPIQPHGHLNNYPPPPPPPPQAPAPAGFTISGLNLNLARGGGQPAYRPMHPPHDVASNIMTAGSSLSGVENNNNNVGYGGNAEMSNPSNRYNNIGMDHCVDLDSYWPSY